MRRWLQSAADIVVPPLCLACQTRLATQDAVCADCWARITFITHPLCDRLGLPLPFGGRPPLVSAAAAASPPLWNRARAVALYEPDGVAAHLIAAFKYADRHDAKLLLARWMRVAGADLLADADVLVPVPLTRSRLLRRRFNQSAILARELSRLTAKPFDAFSLVKSRTTRPQAELRGDARRNNLRGAFTVARPRAIEGRRVLLLDDVLTTGTTAEAATRALLKAGAARVDVLVIAIAIPPATAT
ncbi:MAG: ComF family protein [Hyphomicrobiaceae bacterium]